MVLEIDYKPYDEEEVTLMFHSHYLKEYNGRWHLFGHAEGKEPEYGYNIALTEYSQNLVKGQWLSMFQRRSISMMSSLRI